MPAAEPSSDSADILRRVVSGTQPPPETPRRVPRAREAAYDLPFPIDTVRELTNRPRPKAGWWRYLFSERQKIMDFGNRNHTLAPVFLVPRLRPDPLLGGWFAHSIQASALRLLPVLHLVLQRGWRLVSKRDHNLVVVFWHLCRSVERLELDLATPRSEESLVALEEAQTLLFVIHRQQRGPERIIQTISTVLAAQPEVRRNRIPEVRELAVRLIGREYELPSLFNVLLTFNMLRSHEFLTLDDLVPMQISSVIGDAEFAGNASLRREIEQRVGELKDEVVALVKKRKEARRVQAYLGVAAGGAPDLTELGQFYEQSWGENGRSGFSRDYENVVQFVPRLLRLVDTTLVPFLTGAITLEEGQPVSLFGSTALAPEVQRLRNVETTLERLFFNIRDLPLPVYRAILGQQRQPLPLELEVVQQLELARSAFRKIGRHLDALLRSIRERRAHDNGSHSEADGRSETLLRAWDRRISEAGPLNGLSVGRAVEYVVRIAYISASYLGDRELLEGVDSEDRVNKRIASLLSELKRIVGEEEYRSFEASLDEAGEPQPARQGTSSEEEPL